MEDTTDDIERNAWRKRQRERKRGAFRIKLRKKFSNNPQLFQCQPFFNQSLSLGFGTEEVDWMKEGF